MARKKAEEDKPLEVDGIPTAIGLVRRGRQFAYTVAGGRIHITDEGHRLLGDMLRERARYEMENGIRHGLRRNLG